MEEWGKQFSRSVHGNRNFNECKGAHMKKLIMLLVILILFVLVPLRGQETVKEEVKVVNVEVPVRVFCKGKPVDHLTIGDFKLYENMRIVRMNYYFMIKNQNE